MRRAHRALHPWIWMIVTAVVVWAVVVVGPRPPSDPRLPAAAAPDGLMTETP